MIKNKIQKIIKKEFTCFLQAIGFLTYLPIPENTNHDQSLFASSICYYPLVGTIIGIFSGLSWYLATCFFPSIIAAGIAIGISVILTGAMHEDGLADTMDGFGVGKNKARILEIMRDSQIGVFAAIALIFSIGLRWFSIAEMSVFDGICAIILAHTISRAMILIPVYWQSYVRKQGLAINLDTSSDPATIFIASLTTIAVTIFFGGFSGIILLVIAITATGLICCLFQMKIAGYTGDTLGATQQISEVLILLSAVPIWGIES